MTVIEEAIAVATSAARLNALMDAEKAVRDRVDKLPSYKLSEMRELVNAANAIKQLRGTP